jgi:hypothetical protein
MYACDGSSLKKNVDQPQRHGTFNIDKSPTRKETDNGISVTVTQTQTEKNPWSKQARETKGEAKEARALRLYLYRLFVTVQHVCTQCQ